MEEPCFESFHDDEAAAGLRGEVWSSLVARVKVHVPRDEGWVTVPRDGAWGVQERCAAGTVERRREHRWYPVVNLLHHAQDLRAAAVGGA
jgi:hypothetical protein